MSEIKILAGDFAKNAASMFTYVMRSGSFSLYTEGKWKPESINIREVEALDIASEESVKKLGGTVGWGLAGAALLGPVGLLAGALVGGQSKTVTFVCKFKDGRKFMGIVDQKGFTNMQAALIDIPYWLDLEEKKRQKDEKAKLERDARNEAYLKAKEERSLKDAERKKDSPGFWGFLKK